MAEFYYGQTPASMIYYGKQLIYDSTASAPGEPTEYEEVNLYFYPDKKLLNDVIYISDIEDQEFIAYEAKKTTSGGKECYKATVSTDIYEYIYSRTHENGKLIGYKVDNSGWSYKLGGSSISFSKTKLNNAIYPEIDSPSFGTIEIDFSGGFGIESFSFWDGSNAAEEYDATLIPLENSTIAILLSGEELEYESGYKYYATVNKNDGTEAATIEIQPNEDNFIIIDNSISNYDENGYYNLTMTITAMASSYSEVMLSMVSDGSYNTDTIVIENINSGEQYMAHTEDGTYYTVLIPSQEEYAMSSYNNETNEVCAYKPISNEGLGWSYKLAWANGDETFYVDVTEPEVEIGVSLASEPTYGNIDMSIDGIDVLNEITGSQYTKEQAENMYLFADVTGNENFDPDYWPIEQETAYMELFVNDNLDPDYTYWAEINGNPIELSIDDGWIYLELGIQFDANGNDHHNIIFRKELKNQPEYYGWGVALSNDTVILVEDSIDQITRDEYTLGQLQEMNDNLEFTISYNRWLQDPITETVGITERDADWSLLKFGSNTPEGTPSTVSVIPKEVITPLRTMQLISQNFDLYENAGGTINNIDIATLYTN